MKTLFTLSFTFLLMSSAFASTKSSCTIKLESWYIDIIEKVFSPKNKVFKFDAKTLKECLEKAVSLQDSYVTEDYYGVDVSRNLEKFKVEFDVRLVKP